MFNALKRSSIGKVEWQKIPWRLCDWSLIFISVIDYIRKRAGQKRYLPPKGAKRIAHFSLANLCEVIFLLPLIKMMDQSDRRSVLIFDWDDTILPSSFVDQWNIEHFEELPAHVSSWKSCRKQMIDAVIQEREEWRYDFELHLSYGGFSAIDQRRPGLYD